MRLNYLVEIRAVDDDEKRFLTVYALDEGHAELIGTLAARAMLEEWHKGREFYVEMVTALD